MPITADRERGLDARQNCFVLRTRLKQAAEPNDELRRSVVGGPWRGVSGCSHAMFGHPPRRLIGPSSFGARSR
jgi:hypothetical protein